MLEKLDILNREEFVESYYCTSDVIYREKGLCIYVYGADITAIITKQEFFELCSSSYFTQPDYPFDEDFETAVLRHADNKKWYAIAMRVSRRKFGFDSDEVIDVVNLKLPTEMFGSFGAADGVYPAYHMNKLHWISVLLPDAPNDVVQFLVNVSFEATKKIEKRRATK